MRKPLGKWGVFSGWFLVLVDGGGWGRGLGPMGEWGIRKAGFFDWDEED
jgi:hypothetical protein